MNNLALNNSKTFIRFLAVLVISLLFIGTLNYSYAENPTDLGKGVGISNFKVEVGGTESGYKVTGTEYAKGWNGMIGNYRTVIMAVSAFAILTLGGAFVVSITKLGTSAGNPQARSQAIMGLLWSGVAIAIVGASGIVFGFFYNVF